MTANNISSSIRTITPEYAGMLLKHNHNNRPINRVTVEDYKAQMNKGLWRLNGEPIIISCNGNLLDGQHRLIAVCESGKTIQSFVTTGVDDSTFVTIDTGRVRTGADVFNIEEIPNATQKAAIVTGYFAIKTNNTSSATRNNTRRLKTSKAELLDFYNKHAGIVDEAYAFAAKCHRKINFMTNTEIGSMFLYLILDRNHPQMKVQSFFEELFTITPITNSSVQCLYDTLLKGLLGKKVMTPAMRKAYIIKTWNYYAIGKEVKNLTYDKVKEGFITYV